MEGGPQQGGLLLVLTEDIDQGAKFLQCILSTLFGQYCRVGKKKRSALGGGKMGEKRKKAVCDAVECFREAYPLVFPLGCNLHHGGHQEIPFFGQKEWQDERKRG